jgi:hypothetical protein
VIGERAFPHGGAGLGALCDWLLATTGAAAATIAVAIEVPHRPVVETFLKRGFSVFATNPKQLDRFRDRFTVAGAKDDRLDSRVLGDSLRTDRYCFRALHLADPVVVELRADRRGAGTGEKPFSTIRQAVGVMPNCANAAIPMAVRCARSPIGCWPWPARC